MSEMLPSARAPADYEPSIDTFGGRVILVTGAGSGLGRAVAMRLADLGAHAVLAGKTLAPLEACYDAILAADGAQPAIYPINLAGAGWDDLAEVGANLGEQMQRLDGIVHCAAHFKNFQLLSELQPFDWIEPLQVNLIAPWGLSRACFGLLEATENSTVMFVTCAAGHEATARSSSWRYCSAVPTRFSSCAAASQMERFDGKLSSAATYSARAVSNDGGFAATHASASSDHVLRRSSGSTPTWSVARTIAPHVSGAPAASASRACSSHARRSTTTPAAPSAFTAFCMIFSVIGALPFASSSRSIFALSSTACFTIAALSTRDLPNSKRRATSWS